MKPERKIVAAAITTVALWAFQTITNVEVPIGVEGALVTIVGYWVPSSAS